MKSAKAPVRYNVWLSPNTLGASCHYSTKERLQVMDITPGKEIVKPAHKTSNHFGGEFKHWFGGVHFKFPTFKHDHPPVINVNEVADEQMTLGQKVADKVAATVGSWPFIITQSIILASWIILNTIAWIDKWDPYPYILLNLALSFQAAYAAPFVMMSQNRQAEKDRLAAEHDYCVNIRADARIQAVLSHLEAQDDVMLTMLRQLERVHHIEPDAGQKAAEQ